MLPPMQRSPSLIGGPGGLCGPLRILQITAAGRQLGSPSTGEQLGRSSALQGWHRLGAASTFAAPVWDVGSAARAPAALPWECRRRPPPLAASRMPLPTSPQFVRCADCGHSPPCPPCRRCASAGHQQRSTAPHHPGTSARRRPGRCTSRQAGGKRQPWRASTGGAPRRGGRTRC